MENMGYGQQERLKDIKEKEAEEEQPEAVKEEEEDARGQQQVDRSTGWWWSAIWYGCKIKISAQRKTLERIQGDRKFK